MRELVSAVADSSITTNAVKGIGFMALGANAFGVATDLITFAGGIIALVAGVYLIRRHDTQRELDKLRIEEIYRLRAAEDKLKEKD